MFRGVFVLFVACLVVGCFSQFPTGQFELPDEEWPENGVPGDSHAYPSYDERSMGVWLNVVCYLLYTHLHTIYLLSMFIF